jgi:hypothetical protein
VNTHVRRTGENGSSPSGPLFGRQTLRLVTLLALAAALSSCASPGPPRPDPAETTRSRRAQVVDADTGRPVTGAIVLVVFYLWPERGFGNFPTSKVFRDSKEVVTDQEGRFAVSGPWDSRSWFTEAVLIFKPGYGPWRFQGQDKAPNPFEASRAYSAWVQETWERFTDTGVVIELRPLRTREERLKYMEQGWDLSDRVGGGYRRETPFDPLYFFDISADRLVGFQALVDQERTDLNLPRRQLNGNRQPR